MLDTLHATFYLTTICMHYRRCIEEMATEITYWKAYERFRSSSTYEHVLSDTLRKMRGQVDLSSVKSCLALGCGDGRDEVKFIKELAGNVTKFIGVERDHESTERLKDNLTKNLPDVDTQVIETDVRSWRGPDLQVDLVLLFEFLYYLNRKDREAYSTSCNSTGYAVEDLWLSCMPVIELHHMNYGRFYNVHY